MIVSKICSRCKIEKPIASFHKRKRASDGFNPWCRECNATYCAGWYQDNTKRARGYKIAIANITNKNEPESKLCTKCGVLKPIKSFSFKRISIDGRNWWCRDCTKTHSKNWRKENKAHIAQYTKEYQANHSESYKKYASKYSKKRQASLRGRLHDVISDAIRVSLKGNKSGRKWESLVGYTLEELKIHIERQFCEQMSWDNYGKYGWHIDHKIPMAAFNYEKPEDIDFKRCWDLKNLQPLWAKENWAKNDRVDAPFQPSLAMEG